MKELPTKIAFLEDKEYNLEFLKSAFAPLQDFVVKGCYRNTDEAIAFLAKSPADIVIVDIQLPGRKNGVDFVREIHQINPDVLLMMFTIVDDGDALFESLKAGAKGYLLKRSSDEAEVIQAVRELRGGGSPISPSIARRVAEFFQESPIPTKSGELEVLTDRESQILDLVSKGLTDKEIGENLGITRGTVRQHNYNIYQKLQVKNKIQAVRIYWEEKLRKD